jgi:hypothetical protein
MAILVEDQIEAPFGVAISGLTVTCHGACQIVRKLQSENPDNKTEYFVSAQMRYYKDTTKSVVFEKQFMITITSDQLNGNVFSLIYDKFKEQNAFVSATDI